MTRPLLSLEGLGVAFRSDPRAPLVTAVRDVSLDLDRREVLALIGESGSGKSTVLRAVAGLLPPEARVAGRMRLEGREGDLLDPAADRRGIAGREVAMVFQNPGASLNPVLSVGTHVAEVVAAHSRAGRREVADRVLDLLERVGLPDPSRLAQAFPHQISGGQKQRVAIAAALAGGPSLLLADEPTTALDATVQAQILDLLLRLVDETRIALLFVTHDLAVASAIGDRIAVMKDGRLIEAGPARRVAADPRRPYTAALVRASLPFTRSGGPRPVPASPAHADAGGGLVMAGIRRAFHPRGAGWVVALDGVDLSVAPGEIVGLIGESGSGKSTLGRIAVGLDRPDAGEVRLDGRIVDGRRRLPPEQRRAIQVVFQDPLASFNPRRPVGAGMRIPLRIHRGVRGRAADERSRELFAEVGLDPALASRRPDTLSGGELQRAAIARALASGPRLIVCDEAVASLDVSVRAQVLDLIGRLREREGLSVLFISHDLGVVQRIAERTVVLHRGRVVEEGPTGRVLGAPREDYTKTLVAAVPETLVPWRDRAASTSIAAGDRPDLRC